MILAALRQPLAFLTLWALISVACAQEGALLQSASGVYRANTTITATIPFDDTPPLITEGTEIISVTITPTSPSSILRFRFTGEATNNTAGGVVNVGIFRHEQQEALAADYTAIAPAFYGKHLAVESEVFAGTTDPVTFSVRAGPDDSTHVVRFNGWTEARKFGGAMGARLVVEEVQGPGWDFPTRLETVAATSPWTGKDGMGLIELDGSLYLMGGWNPYVYIDPGTTSEFWRSDDNGETWVQLPDAPWGRRHSAGWLKHDGRIVVIGGDANSRHYQRDIWTYRADEGWVLKTILAPPLAHGRVLHQVFSHAGKVWIVGGQTIDETAHRSVSTKPGTPFYYDVWSSEDLVNWTLVSDNNDWGGPQAGVIGNAVKDGYMWLIGGGSYDTEGYARTYKNTVRRSVDGVTWEEVPQHPEFSFTPRYYHNIVVVNNVFILLAGSNGHNISDAWASGDGSRWVRIQVSFTSRHAASAVAVNDNEVVFLGGPLEDTSVMRLSRPTLSTMEAR